MDQEIIIDRLCAIWLGGREPTREEAFCFLLMYREMQDIDREIAEEQRIEHAREMSKPRR